MPNHVINEVLLHGRTLADCQKHLFNAKGELSFAVLLPLPLNFWPGSAGAAEEKAFPGTHLDAARETWGTKWDAYEVQPVDITDDGIVLRFQTAWDHPRGWVCAVFNTLGCDITASWLSDGGGPGHVEMYRMSGDGWREGHRTWSAAEVEEGSPAHRHLYRLLWDGEEFDGEAA